MSENLDMIYLFGFSGLTGNQLQRLLPIIKSQINKKNTNRMLKKILSKLRKSYFGFNLGRSILSTPFIINNTFYDFLYNKKIKKSIKKLGKQPLGIDIGTTNICNSNCIMCPHSNIKNIGTMDMKLYKKIIDNCSKLKVKSVILSFFGEPVQLVFV